MTKRDNERLRDFPSDDKKLTRVGLIEKRALQLLEQFDMHRGQLPEPLLTACVGLRDAISKPDDVVKPAAAK